MQHAIIWTDRIKWVGLLFIGHGPIIRESIQIVPTWSVWKICMTSGHWLPKIKGYFSWNMCFVRLKDFSKKLKTSQLLPLVLKLIPKQARKKEYGYWIGPMESFEKYFWLGYTICDFWMFVCSKIRPRKQMINNDFKSLFSCSFILTFWKNDKSFFGGEIFRVSFRNFHHYYLSISKLWAIKHRLYSMVYWWVPSSRLDWKSISK